MFEITPELLKKANIPEDAHIEIHESIWKKIITLAGKIEAAAAPEAVNEKYQKMLFIPRGGFEVVNVLSRICKFPGEELINFAINSYQGTQRAGDFIVGQFPNREDVRGKRILVVDEICDSGKTLVEVDRVLKINGATQVDSAVIHYKPAKSESDYRPTFYVEETDKWVVYPWEYFDIVDLTHRNI